MKKKIINIKAEALTAESFLPFGDVIEADTSSANHFSINDGAIERFNDLAHIDTGAEGGRTLVNIAICNYETTLPFSISLMERHPLSSQAFIPLDNTPMIVAVAQAKEDLVPSDISAFITNGYQGINYHKDVWHMPMTPLKKGIRLLMIDRGDGGGNYAEHIFTEHEVFIHADVSI